MKQFISKTDHMPYMNVIFGNFFCPAYNDEKFVENTMKLIKELGYSSVMFDTKAWEDFRERYETGKLSQYVKMQEFMGECALKYGLSYNFLLLYLNGDNLYPHIRFSPPIFGEETVYLDGRPGRWYKYWSDKAQKSMKDHVDRIMERYGAGCEQCEIEEQKTVKPVCSMWDPVVAPSFDDEGKKRYLDYLKELYKGEIRLLNSRYHLKAENFESLLPEEYWYAVRYEKDPFFTEEDVSRRSGRFWVWRDNMLWKIHELTEYFKTVGALLKEKNSDLFLCPDLSQWGYFLNIYGRMQQDLDNEFSDLWDTALRGIDMYALAPYLDSCHFITVPVTPDGFPDAYVVSCQHSMMRVMNEGKPLIGGIYWGRYIYSDIYALLSPAEILGSMAACGIDGYTCYGMNGLDDGGVLNRMDPSFLESLKSGNQWCKKVIQLRRGSRKKEIALLFPSEMAHLEPFEVGNNKIRRLDLLGWYKLCCDLGYQTDVISNYEIEKDRLEEYKVLIIPANDCYFALEHELMEEKICSWVRNGGVVIHGPGDLLAENCFGIAGESCEKKPYCYGNVIIAQGERFCRYNSGEKISEYIDNGGDCIVCHTGEWLSEHIKTGKKECLGSVYSFGIQIGASYGSKNIPHVPYDQGNKEMYPLALAGNDLISDILSKYVIPAGGIREKGIETGVFENGLIIVNHRSAPFKLPRQYATQIFQYPGHKEADGYGILGGHEAVWVSDEASAR